MIEGARQSALMVGTVASDIPKEDMLQADRSISLRRAMSLEKLRRDRFLVPTDGCATRQSEHQPMTNRNPSSPGASALFPGPG